MNEYILLCGKVKGAQAGFKPQTPGKSLWVNHFAKVAQAHELLEAMGQDPQLSQLDKSVVCFLSLSPKTLEHRNYLKRNVSVTLLRLLSCRMMADNVLLVTHSSSLPIPSGTASWHKCRGSMLLLTNGMAPSYIVDTAPAEGKQYYISGEQWHPKSMWMTNELCTNCTRE